MNNPAQAQHAARSLREVGGRLLSSSVVRSRTTQVEHLSRSSKGVIDWRFRQDQLALLWFRQGVMRSEISLEGKAFASSVDPRHNLIVLPSGMLVEGRFTVDSRCSYMVALFDTAAISTGLEDGFSNPRFFFGNGHLESGLLSVFQRIDVDDCLRDLYLEGWAMQALALMASGSSKARNEPRGGLGSVRLRTVLEFIHQDIAAAISLDDLATTAGLSKRHFLRAFQHSTGRSPAAYLRDQRVEQAKALLTSSNRSLTDVAISCGFAHAQHFSNLFRRLTGLTPSQYRQAALH